MHKHFQIFFLFLLLLPAVNASYLTNSFTDYGTDIDSDILFNYLTIEAGVYIDANKDYIIYGILEDSESNLLEYSDCKSLSTGNYDFILDFDGSEIYRKQVDGPYKLKYIELSSISECEGMGLPEYIDSLDYAYNTSFYQYTEFQKGKAAIYCNNSPCIASSELIKSRDSISGTIEPNAPNTIDGCKDGSYGSYLSSESIENITVTSLSHNFFKTGDTVQVDIFVYCDSTYDRLNFVYANDIDTIQWTVKDSVGCSSTGLTKFSTNFPLDNNIGQHAIRGVFGFNLQAGTICGEDDPQPDWVDNDDIVIYVNEGQYELILSEGWNLVSLPKIENTSINEVIKLFGNFERIVALKNGEWYAYDTVYSQNSNLNELSEAEGFWIKMNEETNISIENESAGYVTFNLTKGWNLIGYPSLEVQYVNDLFQDVIEDIELLYIFNNTYKSFNPNLPTNFSIHPGMGIFVKVKNDVAWYFDGKYSKGEEIFNLNLADGWNLISLPLQPVNSSVAHILKDLSGQIIVWHYNASADIWTVYDSDAPFPWLNTLNTMSYGNAYWLSTTINQTLSVQGSLVSNYIIGLVNGWNFVGYNMSTSTMPDPINDLTTPIMVWTYYTAEDEWKVYDTSGSLPNTLNNMSMGKGYLLKSSVEQDWTI